MPPPKGICVLLPRTFDILGYWQWRIKVAYEIKVNQMTLRCRVFLRLSGWTQHNHKGLVSGGGGRRGRIREMAA